MNARGSPNTSGPPSPRAEHAHRGGNPLRRPSDVFEWWFRRLLVAVLLVGLPVAAYSAGTTAYETSMRTARAQAAQRHEVTARLTENVKRDTYVAKQPAQVRWTDTHGVVRTAMVLVKPGTSKGTAVLVWVNRNGTVTGPPTSVLHARTAGWTAGGAAAFGTAFGVYGVWAGTRLPLDRRRYARWDTEWERAEPLWSARFRR
ncbi:hypothetical protein ABZV24_01280 [Streptomyces sp. NPDC005251]|uniref:Rv1733c family protein n=1 Tax=Streptomyces sp. NPDC005251 TaxID=3157166 RepID=UPI0033B756F9